MRALHLALAALMAASVLALAAGSQNHLAELELFQLSAYRETREFWLVEAEARFTRPTHAALKLLVNGAVVAEEAGEAAELRVQALVRLEPGLHRVEAVVEWPGGSAVRSLEVEVAEPGRVELPASVPAGAEPSPPQPHYRLRLPGLYVVVARLEGGVWAGAAARLSEPSLLVDAETGTVRVEGAGPGALVTVYCLSEGSWSPVAQLSLPRGGYAEASLDLSKCDAAMAVYELGWYSKEAWDWRPVEVEAGGSCTLPGPCVPVREAPGQSFISRLGPVEPGIPVELPAGVYHVIAVKPGGGAEHRTLTVGGPRPLVAAYPLPDGSWRVVIAGASEEPVTLALESGYTLELPPGEYRLHEPPVSAWWRGMEAELLVFASP